MPGTGPMRELRPRAIAILVLAVPLVLAASAADARPRQRSPRPPPAEPAMDVIQDWSPRPFMPPQPGAGSTSAGPALGPAPPPGELAQPAQWTPVPRSEAPPAPRYEPRPGFHYGRSPFERFMREFRPFHRPVRESRSGATSRQSELKHELDRELHRVWP